MIFRTRAKYAAFVSYRHTAEDRHWAEWVIETLTRFETPKEMVRKGVRPRIGELFRDDKEMAARDDLAAFIKQSLWDSEHLIVVCSEQTPSSDWVRAEIALFKHWGRANKIHALLTAAAPERAFPAELRHWQITGKRVAARMEMAEPAAASVAPVKGKSDGELHALARDKLAAALLGCDFGRLREIHTQRERAETTHHYFEQLIFRRGAPEGVGEIAEAHVSRRAQTLRFESRGGRVVRVSNIDSSGALQNDVTGVAQRDIAYRPDGSTEAIDLRNALGKVMSRQTFNRDATSVNFATETDTAHAQGLSEIAHSFGHASQSGRSEIVRHLLDYDSSGFVIRRRYARDTFNTPAADPAGNFGEAHELDARGLPVRTWYLGPDGERQSQRSGIAEIIRRYDANARHTELAYLNAEGAPTPHTDGDAKYVMTYDAHGNATGFANYGVDNQPVMVTDGYARGASAYDERGKVIEQTYFGADGAPVVRKGGYAKATYRHNGAHSEEAYFGVDGAPVLTEDGYARLSAVRDADGKLSELAYFGIDGEPILNKSGFARLKNTYDANGNRVGTAYFGVDGAPALNKDGVARISWAYDTRGNLTGQTFLGVDDAPILHKDGYASITLAYDARGNQIETAYFGTDGARVMVAGGYSRVTAGYDAGGKLIEIAYFGIDGARIARKEGYSRFTIAYDPRGNEVEQALYGVDDGPVAHRDGYSRFTAAFDARGNRIELAYFGIDGAPVLLKDGYARFTCAYDARGNRIEGAYFGIDSAPVPHKDGYARFTAAYDARGNLIEVTYFGIDGASVALGDGYARFTAAYDSRGKLVKQAYFGVDGAPTLHKEGYASFTSAYDARGNQTDAAYFGIDGAPILHKDGYARFTAAYDARGNRTEWTNFGIDGAPVASRFGEARITWKFDARGHCIERAVFGVDGGAVMNTLRYHRRTQELDALGRPLAHRYFGTGGGPVARSSALIEGDHIENLFGEWRDVVLSGLLSQDEQAAIQAGGFHEVRYTYDKNGAIAERRFLDASGTEAIGPNGFSVEGIERDASDRPIKYSPAKPGKDTPWAALAHDNGGKAVLVEFRNRSGQLCNGVNGAARAVLAYAPDGARTVAYFNAAGAPLRIAS